MKTALVDLLTHPFQLVGRSNRPNFWFSFLAVLLFEIFLGFVNLTLGNSMAVAKSASHTSVFGDVILLITFLTGWIFYSMCSRRMQDAGLSSTLAVILTVIMIVASLISIISKMFLLAPLMVLAGFGNLVSSLIGIVVIVCGFLPSVDADSTSNQDPS